MVIVRLSYSLSNFSQNVLLFMVYTEFWFECRQSCIDIKIVDLTQILRFILIFLSVLFEYPLKMKSDFLADVHGYHDTLVCHTLELVSLYLKIVFILNSSDATLCASHLGLHCLSVAPSCVYSFKKSLTCRNSQCKYGFEQN